MTERRPNRRWEELDEGEEERKKTKKQRGWETEHETGREGNTDVEEGKRKEENNERK